MISVKKIYKDLLRFLNMIEPIFNNLLFFTEKNTTYATTNYLYNILKRGVHMLKY